MVFREFKDGEEKFAEIERLKEKFFTIGGNHKVGCLKELREEYENFLAKNDSEEIDDLVQIITANLIYLNTDSRDKARACINHVWDKLIAKEELSLYEIRILNPILFAASSTEELIAVTNKCLQNLCLYRYNPFYVPLRISILTNLIQSLMDDKFFSEDYEEEYDNLIKEYTSEIIELNVNSEKKHDSQVALALTYKGVVMKDKDLFRAGISYLETLKVDFSKIDRAIKFYMDRYDIVR